MNSVVKSLAAILLVSCSTKAEKVKLLINSTKPTDQVKGFCLIGESGDTSYVKRMLQTPYAGGTSYSMNYYGVTVYQSRMNALKKISGLEPPREITRQPDSVIVDFYRHWAISKGYKLTQAK